MEFFEFIKTAFAISFLFSWLIFMVSILYFVKSIADLLITIFIASLQLLTGFIVPVILIVLFNEYNRNIIRFQKT